MKSLMLNQNSNTFIKFYILIHQNIYNEQKEIIDTICKEHNNCNITYFVLKDEFKDISTSGFIQRTTAIYYRLLLQNLLPNETKTLYFDCDTLIYKDLNKLYNFDIKNKYYVGQYEGPPLDKYGPNLTDFINSGVLLINLINLRKDNIFLKIYEFLRKNNKNLAYLDQDAINVVCNKKNGFFPSDYISSGVCDSNTLSFLNKEKAKNYKLIKNLKEPYIFHFKIYNKPWFGIAKNNGLVCYDFFPRFYEYAKKTSYYFEILENFKVFNKV
jgi:lipopolysaccharide biosynthesis glycosyltransferase